MDCGHRNKELRWSQSEQKRPIEREKRRQIIDFQLVDVFGVDPFTGNPLAVVEAEADLSDDTMQRMTRWLNLSETAFLLPPTDPRADYRVRIFTLAREMPFAGHPTLGSCHAWLTAGGRPRRRDMVIQECGVGLVPVKRTDGLAFAAPALIRGGAPSEAELAEAAAVLRLDRSAIVDAAWADNGPGWIALMLASAEEVLAVAPVARHERRVDIGLVGPHPPGGEAAFEVRAIFSDAEGNLREDPVTGSLNASIGHWPFASGRVSQGYTAPQGTRLGRTGRVRVSRNGSGQIWVGGSTRTLFRGCVASAGAAVRP